MSKQNPDPSRRRFLRGTAAGLAAVPVAGLFGTASAAEKPKLDPSDPQAKGLSYVHDASKATDNSAYKEGAHCANCMQWKGGDKEWGGCNIFPGKRVHRSGWCTAWVEQTG